jgi:hypothetical protein
MIVLGTLRIPILYPFAPILDFVIEGGHLDRPAAAEFPAGGGGFKDEIVLDLVGGFEARDEGLKEPVESVVVMFAFEEHELLGSKSVFASVLR